MSERVYEIMKQQVQALLPETDYDKGVVNGRLFIACGGNKAVIASANEDNESKEYWQGVLDGIQAEKIYQQSLIAS